LLRRGDCLDRLYRFDYRSAKERAKGSDRAAAVRMHASEGQRQRRRVKQQGSQRRDGNRAALEDAQLSIERFQNTR